MILNPHQEVLPITWEKVFPLQRPLAVEIGFGNGAFLETIQHTYNTVGFEVSLVSMERALSRIDKDKCAIVCMDGVWGIRELFYPKTISTIFINFPLPWPNRKHHQRRLLTPTKLRIYASRLVDGGTVVLHTDYKDYAYDSARNAELSGLFEVRSLDVLKESTVNTKYERKWLLEGRTIYRLSIKKTQHVEVTYYLRESLMPHAILYNLDREPATGTFRTRSGIIRIADIYGKDDHWLLSCYTSDDDFVGVHLQQKVYIAVHPHPEGYIVKIDNPDSVFKTANVKTLIWLVASRTGKVKRMNFEPLEVEEDLR
ncbi:tRNA (guanine-N7)-methyltransferase [Coprothermobacteraceae bacterium]|nr:tRNA (guanine-N7)-methyltransferase [Coprothermobacteraceae bacterium]